MRTWSSVSGWYASRRVAGVEPVVAGGSATAAATAPAIIASNTEEDSEPDASRTARLVLRPALFLIVADDLCVLDILVTHG